MWLVCKAIWSYRVGQVDGAVRPADAGMWGGGDDTTARQGKIPDST